MNNIFISILVLFMAFPSFGKECEKDVQYLESGAKAPCSGYLFSVEKEKELRLLKTEFTFLSEEIALNNKIMNLYKYESEMYLSLVNKETERADLWRAEAEKSNAELIKRDNSKTARDWLFFAGGILATVAAGYALGQVSK